MKLFLATGNKHKIEEIKAIFQEKELEIYSILDGISIPEVVEDGKTFEENSQKKALEIAKHLNMMTIADDSGLCVDALGGAPGVYSARYSEEGTDEANNQKLGRREFRAREQVLLRGELQHLRLDRLERGAGDALALLDRADAIDCSANRTDTVSANFSF